MPVPIIEEGLSQFPLLEKAVEDTEPLMQRFTILSTPQHFTACATSTNDDNGKCRGMAFCFGPKS